MAHDEAVFAIILERIMAGQSLKRICDADDVPARSTVHKWLAEDPALADRYARACEIRADVVFDELLEIADDGRNDWMERNAEDAGWAANGEHIQRSRLRIDARKWALAKMQPKKYGDRVEVENKHDLSNPMMDLLNHVAEHGKRLGNS